MDDSSRNTDPASDGGLNKLRPGDDHFMQSFANLSQYLGERVAEQTSSEPSAAAERRDSPSLPNVLARGRSLLALVAASCAWAMIGAACVFWIILFFRAPAVPTTSVAQAPPPPVRTATVSAVTDPGAKASLAASAPSPPRVPQKPKIEPRAAIQEATIRPADEEGVKAESVREATPPSAPPPVPAAEAARVAPERLPTQPRETATVTTATVTRMEAAGTLPDKKTSAGPSTKQAAPPNAEVREIQTLLQGFGFDPGSIDGVAGSKTQDAALHYRYSRNQTPSSSVDRRLLDMLRRDLDRLRADAVPRMPAPSVERRQATNAAEAFRDEFGFRYDAQGNRIDRNGRVIDSQSTSP